MLPALAVGAVAAPIIGGIIGAISKSDSDAQARALIQKAVAEYDKIGIPPADAMKVITEQLRSTGQMTPQLEQTFQQADSEMNGVTTDPRGKEAQYAALQQLEDLGHNGGLTLTDEANLEHTLGGIDTKARGAREAINSSLKARGAYGSGAELAAKLQGQQADSQLAHEAGLATAGKAQDRALQSIISAGEMGSNIDTQDFNQKAKIAAAQDEINRFNAANRQNVAGSNVNRTNTAQDYNIKNAQRIADTNTQNNNANAVRNAELLQQQYENQLKLASGKANAYTGQANQVTDAGKTSGAMWGGVGQGVGQIAASIGDAGKRTATGSPSPSEGTAADTPVRYYGDPDEENKRAYA
jgi:hypothetical protein